MVLNGRGEEEEEEEGLALVHVCGATFLALDGLFRERSSS